MRWIQTSIESCCRSPWTLRCVSWYKHCCKDSKTKGSIWQASGASGVFRVRGTDGPISVSAESGGASVTGNSDIGVSLGFGLQIPTIADEMSDAVQDGQTFTIASGLATPVTFEIDFDGTTSTTGAIPVTVFGGGFGGSPDALANAIVSAVSAQFPSLDTDQPRWRHDHARW